jgi:hypothetical protein
VGITARAARGAAGGVQREARFFGVPEGETLEALLDKSAADQQEVTD